MRASVVLATHNKADALDRTLASIFRQSVPFPFEVVVIDDGSNDHTSDVLAKYPVITERIERAPVHRNPAHARNRAIAKSSGDVLIMQSDDVLHYTTHTIEQLVVAAEQHPSSAVFATVYDALPDDTRLGLYVAPRGPWKRAFFFLGAIRRAHVYAIGGNDEEFDEPGYEDAWLRECLMHGAHCTNVFLSEPIGHHQHHERPPAIYGRKGAGSDRMRLLWHQKMKDAVEGRIPWKAKLSILYDHAKEHTQ
jgi:glycosyltransferase involved in cell wall biosynthesis